MENTFYHEKKRFKHWAPRIIFIPIAIAAFILVFSGVLMYLWNSILPEVINVRTITFWQAAGILIISKILFGGFHGGRRHHPFSHRGRGLREKWMNLPPEEREKMRERWCGKFEHTEKAREKSRKNVFDNG